MPIIRVGRAQFLDGRVDCFQRGVYVGFKKNFRLLSQAKSGAGLANVKNVLNAFQFSICVSGG